MTQSRQQYIDNYAEYAMEQMRRYGIPASITLAQGHHRVSGWQEYIG